MGWRDKYKVHPAADVFPMMGDDDLLALGKDIKKNGLEEPVTVLVLAEDTDTGQRDVEVLDGRNRLEAMARASVDCHPCWQLRYVYPLTARTALADREARAYVDPLAFIISKNIHRRHLTKLEQAELIVLARRAAKPHQADVVSEREWSREIPPRAKGGRGKVNEEKAEIVALAAEAGISKPTVERAIAKVEGKTPKPARRTRAEVDAAHVADQCMIVETTWDAATAEAQQHLLRHIVKESDPVALALSLVEMMDAQQLRRFCVMLDEYKMQRDRKRPSTLPAEGRSEDAVDDPTPENEGDDIGDIPACLDRRSSQKERAAAVAAANGS